MATVIIYVCFQRLNRSQKLSIPKYYLNRLATSNIISNTKLFVSNYDDNLRPMMMVYFKNVNSQCYRIKKFNDVINTQLSGDIKIKKKNFK